MRLALVVSVVLLLAGCDALRLDGAPADELIGPVWVLAAVERGEGPTPGQLTLRFFEDGRVAGGAYCNAHLGRYVVHYGQRIRIRRLLSYTQGFCENRDRRAQAQVEQARTYVVRPDGRLVLEGGGRRLVFEVLADA